MEEGTFLAQVVKPMFNVVLRETFDVSQSTQRVVRVTYNFKNLSFEKLSRSSNTALKGAIKAALLEFKPGEAGLTEGDIDITFRAGLHCVIAQVDVTASAQSRQAVTEILNCSLADIVSKINSMAQVEVFKDAVAEEVKAQRTREPQEVLPDCSPKFRYGSCPAPPSACNYDDWNELFWDPARMRQILTLKDGTSLYQTNLTDIIVWTKLSEVDWKRSLSHKSYREVHSMLPVLVGNYRLFVIHSVTFAVLILFWSTRATGWTIRAGLGLLAPFWLTLHEAGFQILGKAVAPIHRVKALLKVIFVFWLPVYTFILVCMKEYGVYDFAGWDALVKPLCGTAHCNGLDLPLFTVLSLHAIFAIFVFLHGMTPRTQNLYNWDFYPTQPQSSTWAMWAFWLVTFALKLTFDILVTRFCTEAADGIWMLRYTIDPNMTIVQPMTVVQLAIILFPGALCVFSSLTFFTHLMIALVGSLHGLKLFRTQCGQRRGLGFQSVPENVSKRVVQIREQDRQQEVFVEVWREMLRDLRSRDLVSDTEFRGAQDGPLLRSFTPQESSNCCCPDSTILPSNKEAKRRVLAFARASRMPKQAKAMQESTVRRMPMMSILIPHYNETLLYRTQELLKDDSTKTDMFKFLLQYFPDEVRNFAERMDADGEQQDLNAAFCKWSSLRMQTLWRTVEGICLSYKQALLTLHKLQEDYNRPSSELEQLVRSKIHVVVAMQKYAHFSDPSHAEFNLHNLEVVEAMFSQNSRFGELIRIAYIEEEDTPDGKKILLMLDRQPM
jgi:hypothetical protein